MIPLLRCCRVPQALQFYHPYRRCAGKSEETATKDKIVPPKKALPEPPTTCCMTGCPECVWLDYAEELSDFFKDSGEKAKEEIEKHVEDGNMRAFLLHELRMRKKS